MANLVPGGGSLAISEAVMEAPSTLQVLCVLGVSMAFFIGMLLLLISFTWPIPAGSVVLLRMSATTLLEVSAMYNLSFIFAPGPATAAVVAAAFVVGCFRFHRLRAPQPGEQLQPASAQFRTVAEELVVASFAAITTRLPGSGSLAISGTVKEASSTLPFLFVLAVSTVFFFGVLSLFISFARPIPAGSIVLFKLTATTLLAVSVLFNLAFIFAPRPARADTVAAAAFVVGCLLFHLLRAPQAGDQVQRAAAPLRTAAEELVVSALAAITILVPGSGSLAISGAVREDPSTLQILCVLAVSMAFFVGVLLLIISFTRPIPAGTVVLLKLTATTLLVVSLLFNLAFIFASRPDTAGAVAATAIVFGFLFFHWLRSPQAGEQVQRAAAEEFVVVALAAISNLVPCGGPTPILTEGTTTLQVLCVLAVSLAFFVGLLLLLLSVGRSIPTALISYPTVVLLKLSAAVVLVATVLFKLDLTTAGAVQI